MPNSRKVETSSNIMSGLYVQTVPVFIKFLKNLSKILDKGAAYATDKSIPHDEMANLRLVDDMKA